MKLAITGGRGLIGQALTSLALARGHAVISVDRAAPPEAEAHPNLTHVQADVVQYAELESALQGCDALVHLAAFLSPHGRPDYEVHNHNVTASYNALSAAARLGVRRVVLASSINATGAYYSRRPRYDYLPLDENHPTYSEDPYSLSKWLGEQQADSFARRCETMTLASLRFHWVVAERPAPVADAESLAALAKQLWGYTGLRASAEACWLALHAGFQGHEVFYIVAPETMAAVPSPALKAQFFPDVPLRREVTGHAGFYDCGKAERLLGWRHADFAEAGGA